MAVIPKHNGKRVYENYEAGKYPQDNWDVIVIGSGIGGMSCASALAHKGKKVLVLEQHYIPGGFTHSYARKGYQWDAGVHAIGQMKAHHLPAKLLKWLTNDGVEMLTLGKVYDTFKMPDGSEVGFPDNFRDFEAMLKERFPEQSDNLDAYFDCVKKAASTSKSFFLMKTMPKGVSNMGGRLNRLFNKDWWGLTTNEVLDEVGIEGHLRTILTVHWGYIGSVPKESSFAYHALTQVHFFSGAYYPKGGSKQFAACMLGNVIDNGGLTLCKASVAEILIEKGKAKGVKLADGATFKAPIVISAAGAKNTVNELITRQNLPLKWANRINAIGDSPPYVCLNMGFRGDIREAGASTANQWIYEEWGNEKPYWNFSDPDEKPHILYISYPSLKDPEHDPGPKEKHTGECVTFISWEEVKAWKDTLEDDRPEAYEKFKQSMIDRMLAVMREHIPEVIDKLDYYELSTPLTTVFYTRAIKGAIYGLEATPERFKSPALSATTPIKNLYLTGVDMGGMGVVGGMLAGVLTAATLEKSILKRFT